MTVKHTMSTTTKCRPCSSCSIYFSKDGGDVRIVVEQNPDADDRDKQDYNSAHRQCLLHMVARPPKTFKCITFGDFSCPRTEVILQRSVVEQLPLLLDISDSTSSVSESSENVEMELPCSVWGIVSLLLLLEGAVKQHHWFGVDCDPSLPVQTLLAADFLGCKAARKDIIQYLQRAVNSVVDQGEKAAAADASATVLCLPSHATYSRDWHNFQVLRYLPHRLNADVFQALDERSGEQSKGVFAALHLPQDLLARWVSTCAAPVLDLRDTDASLAQWMRLLTAMQQDQGTATELHIKVPAGGKPKQQSAGSQIWQRLTQKHYNVPMKYCRACLQRMFGNAIRSHSGSSASEAAEPEIEAAGPAIVAQCANCDDTILVERLSEWDFDDAAVSEHPPSEIAKPLEVLHLLAGILPSMRSLQHLGLHHLQLQGNHMRPLGQVLLSLPPSLTTLTLATSPALARSNLQHLCTMLFNAISMIKSLRELHMPRWEYIVCGDVECVQPLYRLPHLEVIYVGEVKKTSSFPADLPFKPFAEAK